MQAPGVNGNPTAKAGTPAETIGPASTAPIVAPTKGSSSSQSLASRTPSDFLLGSILKHTYLAVGAVWMLASFVLF